MLPLRLPMFAHEPGFQDAKNFVATVGGRSSDFLRTTKGECMRSMVTLSLLIAV